MTSLSVCIMEACLPTYLSTRPALAAVTQVPAALMVALFAAFQLPAFSGPRLGAVATLLAGFAPAGLCLTYLVQAAFQVSAPVVVVSLGGEWCVIVIE